MAELTPVERGLLLTLMSAGKPLRESADIKAKYGFAVTPAHRTKLQALGLVRVTKSPWTHELTENGWRWAQEELSASPPKGQMGLGPLYAVLNGLERVLRETDSEPQKFFQKKDSASRNNGYHDDVADAAWSSADEALARSLQDLPSFERALRRHRDGASTDVTKALEQVRLAAGLVFQHLELAASQRGLKVKYERAQRVDFDPVEFDSDVAPSPGEKVEVLKSPIVKKVGENALVVIRGLAEPAD